MSVVFTSQFALPPARARALPKPRTDAERDLVGYLENLERLQASVQRSNVSAARSWSFSSMADLVLSEGVWGNHRPKPTAWRWGEQGQCYGNAGAVVLGPRNQDGFYTYCEGFAWREGLPIAFEHAWVLTPDGSVIDHTWQGEERTPRAYLGIPFQAAYLRQVVLESQRWGVIDRWTERWPLLSGAHQLDDAVDRALQLRLTADDDPRRARNLEEGML